MSQDLILAVDQGTTGTTVLLLDPQLRVKAHAYQEFPQIYPRPGWVSHDPETIWNTVITTVEEALHTSKTSPEDIASIGITNQRETTVLWDKASGVPVDKAIVWQCRRSADIVERWCQEGLEPEIRNRTGLVPDAYFSASKIRWLLEQHEGLEERCRKGEICFGTIDSWLIWKMTGGRVHATEPSNASRTMLFNIHNNCWDEFLLHQFRIPPTILPQVKPSVSCFGTLDRSILGREIPILGIAGDQQAALFGQGCFEAGDIKNTYGTGCFLMMHTGRKPVSSQHGLLSTIAWDIGGELEYALEGSVFSAGSAVKWIRDGLGLIQNASETEALACAVESTEGVYMVPAFNGLGAPYWDMYARGAIIGLTRGTRKEHLVRAVLEACAYQTKEVIEAMTADSGIQPTSLRTDGGMVANNFLLQFQADILGIPVERPLNHQSTALGAGCLAGLGAEIFSSRAEIASKIKTDKIFSPAMEADQREQLYSSWKRAVRRCLGWAGA